MEWQTGADGTATLLNYGDQPPGSTFPSCDAIILHSDSIHSHHYPDREHDSTRCRAEIEAFLPEINIQDATVRVLPTVGRYYDITWTSVLAWRAIGTASQCVLADIEADLVLLRREGSVLFIGKRGTTWWYGALDDELLFLDRFEHTTDEPVERFVSERLLEMHQRNPHIVDAILFGDAVQPDTLQTIARHLSTSTVVVRRHQPFRHVRSELSDEQASSVLRRAHVIGCMLAPMMEPSTLTGAYSPLT